jgi:hypothetical protein
MIPKSKILPPEKYGTAFDRHRVLPESTNVRKCDIDIARAGF